MKMNEVKSVLTANGISYEEKQTVKGSCVVDALAIGDGHIKPTVYERTVESFETEEEVMDFVKRITGNVPDVRIDAIKDTEYIKDHCISCIRHETDADTAVVWPCWGDLQEYIRIQLGDDGKGGNMSCIVTEALMDQIDMDAEELRTYARDNLRKRVSIKSMAEVLLGLTGKDMMDGMDEMSLFVATVDSMTYGASVMLLEDVLNDFCLVHNLSSVRIIPSSLHEILLVVAPEADESSLNDMIQSVNASELDPFDVLSDHAYRFEAITV